MYSPKVDLKQCCNVLIPNSKENPIASNSVGKIPSTTENNLEDDEEADEFKELVISILRTMVSDPSSVDFYSDSWFDPSGVIADYSF